VSNRVHAPGTGAGEDPTVVWLTGEHGISTDGALSRALARAIALGATALVIDLSEIQFMGASTLGAIVRVREFLRRRSGTLMVRSAPPIIRRTIDICGLNDLLGPEEGGDLAVPAAGQPGPSGLAPSRLPVPARQRGTHGAPAVGAEELVQSA
jgi:anti-anti-sigma factor